MICFERVFVLEIQFNDSPATLIISCVKCIMETCKVMLNSSVMNKLRQTERCKILLSDHYNVNISCIHLYLNSRCYIYQMKLKSIYIKYHDTVSPFYNSEFSTRYFVCLLLELTQYCPISFLKNVKNNAIRTSHIRVRGGRYRAK